MKSALTTKITVIILSYLVLVGFAALATVFIGGLIKENIVQNQECITGVEEKIVRGGSLAGLIENGQTIKILVGYYRCNEVKRGDMVIYNYAGSADPILKIVKGISGDKFDLRETTGGWHILINGQVLANSEDQLYVIDNSSHRMLSLYRDDYDGLIPENAYLIMGNLVNGSADSTRFGLVHKDDFLGKVMPQ